MTNQKPLIPQELISIAQTLRAKPKSFGLLLGSGVSTSMGFPSAYELIEKLLTEHINMAAESTSIDDWLEKNLGSKDFNYSKIIEKLFPTKMERQITIEKIFIDSFESNGNTSNLNPFEIIAKLVRDGHISFIVTTNFDQLLENNLRNFGIFPQIIHDANSASKMKSLILSQCTIFKINGDFLDLNQLNTESELDNYSDAVLEKLEYVLREFGILTIGWSAKWDKKLIELLNSRPNDYPLYVGVYDEIELEGVKQALPNSIQVTGLNAFQLLDLLWKTINTSTAGIQTTESITLNVFQSYVGKSEYRSMVANAIGDKVKLIEDLLTTLNPNKSPGNTEEYGKILDLIVDKTIPLLQLLSSSYEYGDKNFANDLTMTTLTRLMKARAPIESGEYFEHVDAARFLPALLVFHLTQTYNYLDGDVQWFAKFANNLKWQSPFKDSKDIAMDLFITPRIISFNSARGFSEYFGKGIFNNPFSQVWNKVFVGIYKDVIDFTNATNSETLVHSILRFISNRGNSILYPENFISGIISADQGMQLIEKDYAFIKSILLEGMKIEMNTKEFEEMIRNYVNQVAQLRLQYKIF